MMNHVKGTSYGSVRHSHILVNYEASPPALHALLRVDGSESANTRATLEKLGFEPAAAPTGASISWRLPVGPSDLRAASKRICDALGDQVVLDVGASFDEKLPISPEQAAWWPGQFLVEVGGTRRCVMFDRATEESALASAMTAEREDYFANELTPATE